MAPNAPGPPPPGEPAAAPPAASAPQTTPSDLPARRQRAADLLRAGIADEAAALYAELAAADPSDIDSACGRVRALLRADRWREALADARRFSGARPSDPLLQAALGEALYRAGSLSEARTVLDPQGRLPSPPARALMALGMLRVAEGREDDAAAFLDRALALAPDDRDVLFLAAGAAPTRAEAVRRLESYLALSGGDDPDRIEGAKGTISLYRVLGERRVWIPVERPERLELPLRAFPDHAGRTSGYYVELRAGGRRPIRVLLDTGSTGLFLLERIAVKAGFAPLADQVTFAGGGDGRTPSKRGMLPEVALGALRFQDALVSTTTQELDPTGRYHGVLGISIFQGYRVTLDLPRERLILERSPGSALTEGAPYWSVASQMLIEAATTDGSGGLFLFDTGSTRSLLSLAFAESHYAGRLGSASQVRTFGGLMKGARSVHGVRLRYQGRENAEPVLNAGDLDLRSRLGGVEVSGFLGLDILDRTRIIIDTVFRRVTLVRSD